ncbi:hypothetical protein FRB98_000259 [Tulasnella sp. 332]|nr:hypothetical protein FRB98_000259 [Tulasnella sp. 332]
MMPQTPTNEPGAATTFPGITPPPISPEHYIFTPSAGTYVPISLTATMSSTLALASQNPDTQQQTSPSPTAQAFPPPAYDSVVDLDPLSGSYNTAIQIRSREQIARILVSHASTIRRSRQRLGTIGFPDCRVAYQDGKVREGPSPADQEDPAPQSQVWNHIPSSRQAPGKLSGRMSNPVNSFSAAIPPVFPAAVLTPISNNDWSTSNGLFQVANIGFDQRASQDLMRSNNQPTERLSSPRITDDRTSASAPHRTGPQEEADRQYAPPFSSDPALTSYQSQSGTAGFDRRTSQDLGYSNNGQRMSSPRASDGRVGGSRRPVSLEESDRQYALSLGADEARNSPSDEDLGQRSRGRPLTDNERTRRDPSPGRPILGGYTLESSNRLKGTRPLQGAWAAGLVHAGRNAISSNRPPSKPSTILFYESTKPFYGFTNFSPHEVRFDNKVYPTSEHLFQSMKFLDARPLLAEHIRTAGQQPRVALTEARRFAPEARKDWYDMEQVVFLKFQQHPSLKQQLLSTGDAKLVENAGANDAFWGNGADGNGRNELGIALMKLRDHFRLEGTSRAQR